MLEVLLVGLLAIHLLLVDVAMFGPLCCVWIEWRRGPDDPARAVAQTLMTWSIACLLIGAPLGGMLLLLRWWLDDQAYLAALAAIPRSRLWFGLLELLFSLICMASCLGIWRRWPQRRVLPRVVAVAGATNLIMHFPALFAVVNVLSTRGGTAQAALDRSGYQQLLVDGEVVSRVLHAWLAGLVVTSVVVMICALRVGDLARSAGPRGRLLRQGAWLGLVVTLLQIPSGLWLALRLPETAREPLLGGDLVAALLFLGGLALALSLAHTFAAIAFGQRDHKQVRRALALVVALMMLMVGTRNRVQAAGQRLTVAEGFAIAHDQHVSHSTR